MNTTPICDIIREKIKQLNGSSTLEELLERIQPIEEELQNNSVGAIIERMPYGIELTKYIEDRSALYTARFGGDICKGKAPQEALLALEAKLICDNK